MSNRFGLADNIIDKINTVLSSHPEIEQAVVYGSRARGNHKPGSDIDISLKGNQLTLEILNQIEREIDDLLLPYSFDLSIYHQIDNLELLEHIDRVGVLLNG